MIGIYKITSPSGKVYIGQSVNINNRISKYRTHTCSEQPKLYKSLLKYGFENHIFEILVECSIDELNTKERYYQEFYNSVDNGLNCMFTKDNDRSGKLSKETILKISLNNKRPFLGKKHTKESKLKISNSLKGNKSRLGAILSDETKNKIRVKHLGKKHTQESILKMSKIQSERCFNYLHEQNKKIILNIDTGIFYFGVLEASKSINMNKTTLQNKLNGNRNNNTNLIYC